MVFVIDQCVRYAFRSKRSHEEAMKHTGKYMISSRDIGFYSATNNALNMDFYVDPAFAKL